MLENKKIMVVLPAYQAGNTLQMTYESLSHEVVDDVVLVDDGSTDDTVEVAHQLGIKTILHPTNMGYGANQKTCYECALEMGADVVVMLHPDYQYEPRLVTAMAAMVTSGVYDVVLGSRILGNTARAGGMPLYKYFSNRFLTFFQNLLLGAKLSEYHTGYRAFSREVLQKLPLKANSNDFIFDNQMLLQCLAFDFKVGELSCPTRYFPEASSINFRRSVIYGIGVIKTTLSCALWRLGIKSPEIFHISPENQLKGNPKNFPGAD